jgi:hypothetical protein
MRQLQVTCCLAASALAALQAALSASSCGPSSATSAWSSLACCADSARPCTNALFAQHTPQK